MSTPQPNPATNESLELPVEELLRRGKPHPPYGEHVIEDLTPRGSRSLSRRRAPLTGQPSRGPVVVDTDVYSARLIPNSLLAQRYEPLLVGRDEFLSFQTVAELRYGALLRGWGRARMRRLEAAISSAETVHSGNVRFAHSVEMTDVVRVAYTKGRGRPRRSSPSRMRLPRSSTTSTST